MDEIVGILGGMGPLATADFMRKLVEHTPARLDQEHVPVIVYSIPQIPDRSEAIVRGGPSPLKELLKGAEVLCRAGAGCIAIPCNTAHFWADQVAERCALPVLHIAEAVVRSLDSSMPQGAPVGILGTAGTLLAGIYQKRLEQRGYPAKVPTDAEIEQLLMPGIRAVKGGDLVRGGQLFAEAGRALRARGAQRLILACTEIPLALDVVDRHDLPPSIDATACLAASCVEWWQERMRRKGALV